MSTPVIYRSTDANAPVLFGGQGSLITLLDAILVNGYGSVFATGSITNDTVQPTAGDTVTVGSITYTFQSTIGSTPYNVLIGASASTTVTNLAQAINANGTSGTTYPAGTLPNPDIWAPTVTATVISLQARKGGAAGNSLALSRASAGTPHFSVSGANMTGGSGTDSKASVGWTKSFTDSGGWMRVAYRQPAGCGFYLQVDDSGPGTGLAREARTFGWETMSAYTSGIVTGTGQFPTTAQNTAGIVCRKSTSLDNVARAWIAIADDRTLYLFTSTGDSAGNYHGISFGDFYSLNSPDSYKCLIFGGSSESSSSVTSSPLGQQHQIASGNFLTAHWVTRNYAGVGGSTAFIKVGDTSTSSFTSSSAGNIFGSVGFPNQSDGGLYIAPMRVVDGSTVGTTVSGTLNLRGRLRGFWHVCHANTSFADGDTFSGSGEYAGRTFVIVKSLMGTGVNTSFAALETTAWDTSI